MAKNILQFVALFAYVVGTVGGIGTALWAGQFFIAACVAVLAVLAFPTAREYWKQLKG